MDRELSAVYRQRRKVKMYVVIGTISFVLLAVFIAFRLLITPTLSAAKFSTAIAEKGTIEATITASGIVIPQYEVVITSPINAKIEKVFHHAGEQIQAGESVLLLDKEFTQLSLDKLLDEQELNKNKINKLQLNLEKSLNDLQTQYAIKELKIKTLETALADEKILHGMGGSTVETVEQAALALQIAKLELDHLSKQIHTQRQSMKVDMQELGFEMKIQEKNINETTRKLNLAEIQAIRNGVITWVYQEIGAVVNAGSEVARMADLSSFKIESSISDSYADQLRTGGGVIIRINEKELRGTIANINPAVENGVVKFTVIPDQNNHPLLRSNLKVDVFVITSYKNDIIRVKNGAAFNGSVEQDIFIIKNNHQAIRRKVRTGESNFDYIEITSGLKAGDKIIVSDMADYLHLDELEVE